MDAHITGPYDLARQNEYFGGWIQPAGDDRTIVMAFPVEGWTHSAAVLLRQTAPDRVEGEVQGPDEAWRQALAVLSLDVDGSGYPQVGERDPVIGALQRQHAHLRPVLFHSPYEAACAFIIAHRMRIEQGRAIRQRMAREHGEAFEIGGVTAHAFPSPQRLLRITEVPGIDGEKVRRLHGVAQAALDGLLDRARLRSLPVRQALADVRRLRGVGDFFATAIVMRGAGLVDALPGDEMTMSGMRRRYDLPAAPTDEDIARVTDAWRPYRMWCSVLIHAAERRARAAA
ncbi:DNA-3-methyladenine glycosylase [Dactylosporangium maewongense]|uniref:DNA-3-methyladenine glycosylase n=1 Tax=Dactylosporangium maewongense TaxID=634393 RepID=A0ABN2AZJ2_9ACTN